EAWDIITSVASQRFLSISKSLPKRFGSIIESRVMLPQGSARGTSHGHRQVWGICVFLVIVTWLVFGQTIRYAFVNFDDNEYVYANPAITRGLTFHGVIRA